MKPKPTNQNRTEPTIKSTKFLKRIFAVFLLLVKPASQRAKPGCIKNTNIAASSIHTVSNEIPRSATLFATSATDSVANNIVVIILFFLIVRVVIIRIIHLDCFSGVSSYLILYNVNPNTI